MPVIVDTERCPCASPCYPAKVCPFSVLHFDFTNPTLAATLDPLLCGECKGVCTNFCDPRALRFAPTMEELQLTKAQLLGTMTVEQVALERKRIKEETERKKQSGVLVVTTKTFEQEVLKAELPVAIDFWATWCGPCKTFAPIFAQAAQEFTGKLKFCKIDTDAEATIAQQFRVQSIPTLAFMYQGQVLGAIPGAMSAAQLRSTIDQVLRIVEQMRTESTQTATQPGSPAKPAAPAQAGKPAAAAPSFLVDRASRGRPR